MRLLIMDTDSTRVKQLLKLFENGNRIDICFDADECARYIKNIKYDMIFFDDAVGFQPISQSSDTTVLQALIKSENNMTPIIIHSSPLTVTSKLRKKLKNTVVIPFEHISPLLTTHAHFISKKE